MKIKTNFNTLKYNIWTYFILYTVIMILVIWILQVVFMDGYYQSVRQRELEKTGGELALMMNTDAPDNDNIDKWVATAVNANEAGMHTYLCHEENGELVKESIYSYFLHGDYKPVNVGPEELRGSFLFDESILKLDSSEKSSICYYYTGDNKSGGEKTFCVYLTRVSNELGDYYLFLISPRTSLSEAISVMQFQLIIVTVVVIVISFILAWVIATRLSEPIQRMSNTAKKWAEGDGNAVFAGESYYELNELAEALNYAKEGISKAGILQRDLLANVSHDLKTPLTMIKAYAEMIRDISGDDKKKREAHTNVIIDEADRLAMLVNDILDLSKLQNDSDAENMEQTNLSELVERVIYRFSDFGTREGYKIISNVEPDLFTVCNERQIEQVVYNLIGNSINYTGNDMTVKVSLKKTENHVLLLEIIDSGKGIEPELVDTIWEKYYRFSETHQRPVKGTGLGLSIVKTILQNHKLRFGVISKKGVGSNFFVEFKDIDDERK
ncbi:MAG: HAMP domain-containing sensor histidine kinase [Candidatus Borkfalkiaceae bacterium]|nr:HAMP domain-containing sensor histidine kinase [Christensenellaceae bacterium]